MTVKNGKREIIPGIVSVSFREKSPERIVREAAQYGLKAVEWGSDVHAPAGDVKRLNEVAALTREAGLITCSYGTYLHIGTCTQEELLLHIAAAKILGTNILRLWAGDKDYENYTPEEADAFIGECISCARIAEKENVILCMECHIHTFTSRLEGALRLMRDISSDSFRMYWQPNQFRTAEENLTYARDIAPYTHHIHVFNWDGAESFPLAGAKTLWKAYLNKFEGTHYALLEFMPDGEEGTFERESRVLVNWTEELNK